MNQERKSELLKGIKAELNNYHAAKADYDKYWKGREAHVHNLKRDIMCLTHGEDLVKKIEGYVGQRIMRNYDDSIEILMVDRIEFMKWDIRFHGTGIQLYDDGRSWSSSGFDIRYEDFPGENDTRVKPEPITLVTDASINQIVEKLESERDTKIAKYRDEVKAKYAAIISQIKTCGLDPEKYEKKNPAEKIQEKLRKLRHEENELYDETGFRMSDLVKWFGSDEDKAAFRKEVKELIAAPDDCCDKVIPAEEEIDEAVDSMTEELCDAAPEEDDLFDVLPGFNERN
jgi:hypothetical protein